MNAALLVERASVGEKFHASELGRLARLPYLQGLAGSTIVIVGASGMLGTAVTTALAHFGQGTRVFGLARRSWQAPAGVATVQGSATDPSTYAHLPPPDYVLYIAGTTSDYLSRTWETVDVTLNGLRQAMHYARGCAGFAFVSSTRVYGPLHMDCTLTEETPALVEAMGFDNVYECSKRLAESLLLVAHRRDGLPATTIRLANVYGPAGHLVSGILKDLVTHRRVALRGHPQTTRNYCFVSDAAQGLLLALAAGRRGEAYNVGSTEHRSNLEFICQVAALLSFETEVQVPPDALAKPRSETRISIDKACRELGYVPRATLEACLPFVVDWTLRAFESEHENSAA